MQAFEEPTLLRWNTQEHVISPQGETPETGCIYDSCPPHRREGFRHSTAVRNRAASDVLDSSVPGVKIFLFDSTSMNHHAETFEEQFRSFLERESLLSRGESIALAVSGGPDSMVMLHLFLAIRESWQLSLSIVHVNHQLRSQESDEDEAFVREVASARHLSLHAERVDTVGFQHRRKLSKQEAARILRYDVFERARKALGASLVATAHTADDNAETVLLNILRGTGIRGLAGIPIRRDASGIIRPILFAHREDVERYASERKIRYRIDSSNALVSSTRNLLRHQIIPLLAREVNPDVTGALLRVARTMRELVSRLDRELDAGGGTIVAPDARGNVVLDLKALERAPSFLHDEYLLLALKQAGAPISSEKVMQLRDLWSGQSGRRHHLARNVVAVRDHDQLVLGAPEEALAYSHPVEIGTEYTFPSFTFSAKPLGGSPKTLLQSADKAVIDGATLGKTLTVRSWKPGDWFMPLGMGGRKKLSDFFTDEKISHDRRHLFPVLESDGSIVWICGLRLDDRAKVTPATTRWVELSFHHRSSP
jgi:tRNA(Ile)-lysidine synthase